MRIRRLAVALALALVACVACTTENTGSDQPTNNLEVISWWTSGSEQQALNVLFDAYRKAHPGVTIVNATVAGGGGSADGICGAQGFSGHFAHVGGEHIQVCRRHRRGPARDPQTPAR